VPIFSKPPRNKKILFLNCKILFALLLFLALSHGHTKEKPTIKNVESIAPSYYDDLFEVYKFRSQQGNLEAINNLGAMYLKGLGVSRDETKALEYFLMASKSKFPPAMYHLGLIYYKGLGVDKNLKKAQHWFERAAITGDREAQFFLGLIFATEKDHPKNISESLKWFEAAAKNGMPAAQYNLAILRKKNNQAKEFDQTSLFWLKTASQKLHFESIFALFEFYSLERNRKHELRSTMNKLQTLAEQGHDRAQRLLGMTYFLGRGVERNLQEGEFWMREAASAGLESAKNDLERIYSHPDFSESDFKELIEFSLPNNLSNHHQLLVKDKENISGKISYDSLKKEQNYAQ